MQSHAFHPEDLLHLIKAIDNNILQSCSLSSTCFIAQGDLTCRSDSSAFLHVKPNNHVTLRKYLTVIALVPAYCHETTPYQIKLYFQTQIHPFNT